MSLHNDDLYRLMRAITLKAEILTLYPIIMTLQIEIMALYRIINDVMFYNYDYISKFLLWKTKL